TPPRERRRPRGRRTIRTGRPPASGRSVRGRRTIHTGAGRSGAPGLLRASPALVRGLAPHAGSFADLGARAAFLASDANGCVKAGLCFAYGLGRLPDGDEALGFEVGLPLRPHRVLDAGRGLAVLVGVRPPDFAVGGACLLRG